ncbi:MAG: hypothetical protein HKP13_07325 [Gammaproteobacteria bacterium]|nr:hypothetical protein [Gammaproteobacteria bacterium]
MVKRMQAGGTDNRALNKLRHVLRAGVQTDHVLIALTEISVLLERYPKIHNKIGEKTIIDALRLYGEALADRYLTAVPSEQEDDFDQWGTEV